MTTRKNPSRSQAGFSMVEMLMAAFVLAIGILGLSMLQTMSLKASRGSQSLNMAVQAADRVMDQIEMEGRLSWLNITNPSLSAPITVQNLQYIGRGTRYLGFQETLDTTTNLTRLDPVTTDPQASKPALSASVRYVATAAVDGTTVTAGTGKTDNYIVTVEFMDEVAKTGTRVVRTVNISRSIIHG